MAPLTIDLPGQTASSPPAAQMEPPHAAAEPGEVRRYSSLPRIAACRLRLTTRSRSAEHWRPRPGTDGSFFPRHNGYVGMHELEFLIGRRNGPGTKQ